MPPPRRPLKRAPDVLQEIIRKRPDKRLRVFFEDEARIGQKGRVCHRWYVKGERPPGAADQRFTFAYIFAASEVKTDNAFALVLPEVRTETMQTFLDRFAQTIPDTDHVALFLDRAGWNGAAALKVPDCITLVPLPAYSPELNPVERIWEYLKERYLSHRLLDDYDAIVDAACCAWNKLTDEAGRLTSLTWLPWAQENSASQNL
ncbi:MAG: IS630 family transposase [Rhodomicrobium sp.]|nr:IS630 family transposase [Rhodomicrobium sp.]